MFAVPLDFGQKNPVLVGSCVSWGAKKVEEIDRIRVVSNGSEPGVNKMSMNFGYNYSDVT